MRVILVSGRWKAGIIGSMAASAAHRLDRMDQFIEMKIKTKTNNTNNVPNLVLIQTKCHVTECLEKNSAEIKRMSLVCYVMNLS